MDTRVLLELGLTKGETKVYSALLEKGSSRIGTVIKKSKVSQSKIYDVISKLVQKGLVGYSFQGKIKLYTAATPDRLLDYVDQKKEELEEEESKLKDLIPELKKLEYFSKRDEKVEIFEGIRGIRNFFDISRRILSSNDYVYVIGYNKLASQLFGNYFKLFHSPRDGKFIRSKVIFTYDAWHYKKRPGRKGAEYRYLPKDVIVPAAVYFFNDYVGNIIVTEHQKLCIVIKNQEVADSYMHYFNMVWKQAIKPKY